MFIEKMSIWEEGSTVVLNIWSSSDRRRIWRLYHKGRYGFTEHKGVWFRRYLVGLVVEVDKIYIILPLIPLVEVMCD
jgi:hypothetical protein